MSTHLHKPQCVYGSRKLAAWNAIGGFSYSLCAAVSLPENSVFRLEWSETALVLDTSVYTRSGKLTKAASRRVYTLPWTGTVFAFR